MTFNILITTIARPSLTRMVDSIWPQLNEGDFLTIVADCKLRQVIPLIQGAIDNATCTIELIQNFAPRGYFGHGSRNVWQNNLRGDFIMNADDDDVYTPDAMQIVRQHCTQQKLYIFRMLYNTIEMPRNHAIELCNIGTPCGIIPNTHDLPIWGLRHGGDFDFYNELSKHVDFEFVDKVIYKVKDSE